MAPHNTPIAFDSDGLNAGAWPDPSPERLVTPLRSFFTRSHATVPIIDGAAWQLEVGGLVQRPRSYRLADLRVRFPRRHVTATLICAGMRRNELLQYGEMPGELPWGPEPISTGRWSGVPLVDVLAESGPLEGARYVELIGLDVVSRGDRPFGFGGSIDRRKAEASEVLLATHLNDQPLSPAHGFPLRVVVPGWVGARSVKWLGRIELRSEPSENYFQASAYRVQRTVNPADPHDASAGTALGELPLNAMILEPRPGVVLPAGAIDLRGWAIGTGGAAIESIEVSPDGGTTWVEARKTSAEEPWAWVLWEATVTLTPGYRALVVRATDARSQAQPAELTEVWNVHGYCNNAWHRVPVVVE
jgi:sulfite oxidase